MAISTVDAPPSPPSYCAHSSAAPRCPCYALYVVTCALSQERVPLAFNAIMSLGCMTKLKPEAAARPMTQDYQLTDFQVIVACEAQSFTTMRLLHSLRHSILRACYSESYTDDGLISARQIELGWLCIS
jgi:hypothetical protein